MASTSARPSVATPVLPSSTAPAPGAEDVKPVPPNVEEARRIAEERVMKAVQQYVEQMKKQQMQKEAQKKEQEADKAANPGVFANERAGGGGQGAGEGLRRDQIAPHVGGGSSAMPSGAPPLACRPQPAGVQAQEQAREDWRQGRRHSDHCVPGARPVGDMTRPQPGCCSRLQTPHRAHTYTHPPPRGLMLRSWSWV